MYPQVRVCASSAFFTMETLRRYSHGDGQAHCNALWNNASSSVRQKGMRRAGRKGPLESVAIDDSSLSKKGKLFEALRKAKMKEKWVLYQYSTHLKIPGERKIKIQFFPPSTTTTRSIIDQIETRLIYYPWSSCNLTKKNTKSTRNTTTLYSDNWKHE